MIPLAKYQSLRCDRCSERSIKYLGMLVTDRVALTFHYHQCWNIAADGKGSNLWIDEIGGHLNCPMEILKIHRGRRLNIHQVSY
jgi:hypothetical protein